MSSLQFLATQSLPIEIHTLSVEADGSITRNGGRAFQFGFHHGGVDYRADVSHDNDGTHLVVSAMLGAMPFSAESVQLRTNMIEILLAGRDLGFGKLAVDDKQQVWLVASATVHQPLTPSTLVTAAAKVALEAKPWIELVRLNTPPKASHRAPAVATRPQA